MKKILSTLFFTIICFSIIACEYTITSWATPTAIRVPYIKSVNGHKLWDRLSVETIIYNNDEKTKTYDISYAASSKPKTNLPLNIKLGIISSNEKIDSLNKSVGVLWYDDTYIMDYKELSGKENDFSMINVCVSYRINNGEWINYKNYKINSISKSIIENIQIKLDNINFTDGEIELAIFTWSNTMPNSIPIGINVNNKGILFTPNGKYCDDGIFSDNWITSGNFSCVVKLTLNGGRRPEL